MIKKKLLFTFIAILSVHQAFSQSAARRLGFEINGGINEYQGDLGSALYFSRKPDHQGIGGSISYYLTPNIDLSFFGSGGDVGFFTTHDYPADIKYKDQFFRANVATVNGGLRYKFLKDKAFTPYIMLGIGGVYLHSNVSKDPNSYTGAAGNLAGGFGFQFSFNDKMGIRLQSMFNYTFNDIWDGEPYSYLTHTRNKNNDMFAYHSLGFFFNVPYGAEADGGGGKTPKDKDKDGVPDKLDLCPKTQPWELPVNEEGCPKDSDLDSIPDYQDSCPYNFGPRKFNGCPDKDNDGLIDKKDRCPDKAGPSEFQGCPDTDGDGIIDIEDQCPAVKGSKEFNGCPDTDGDGIEDRKDKCANVAGTMEGEGCPDTDGDGVYDNRDVCPKVAGPASNKGCPEIKQEVIQRIALAAKGINFETGSDRILPESFDDLDALVKILNEYPEAKVAIDGHTDNVGDPQKNRELSQKRADAVRAYLISKGIDPSRLTATGYGDTQPVADNKTKAGKAKNRRVDFKLTY